MDIVIVDDEPLARARLKRMVSDLGHEVVAEAGNSNDGYQAVQKQDPALVLLDIEMPGENGLELAKRIAVLDSPPAVIFTTAYDQYALDAFDTHAAAYLLKPVQSSQLGKALEKASAVNKLQLDNLTQQANQPNRDHISAKSHRGVELIPLDSIRCFLADQKYVMVVGTEGNILIDETLKELEAEFCRQFLRVHRNALVSIKHIDGLERNPQGHYTVRLTDTDEKPMVSRRYASKVKSLLKSL